MLFSLMSGGYSSHRSKESYAFDCASIPSSASPPSGIFTTPINFTGNIHHYRFHADTQHRYFRLFIYIPFHFTRLI